MHCPTCPDTLLVMTERKDVEIDYCPKCRGVWLDRGEIDKIIERSVAEQLSEQAPAARQSAPPPSMRSDEHRYEGGYQDRYKKKKSIWHEIFD